MMMRQILSFFALTCLLSVPAVAQEKNDSPSIADNWYLQLGMDMSLQNPYGHNFTKVFPNGKSFGVDVAVGRWFTSELGIRVKYNWENGIPLFENGHANWIAPFDQPGVNMDKGGYMILSGDVQFDMHNLIFGYDPDRMWNLQFYPRAGIAYNLGVKKGSPLIGVGVSNTFQLTDCMGLYVDVAYNGVSSGFTGVEKNTGAGSNSCGFFDLNLGVQYNLGKRRHAQSNTFADGFWNDWFLQAGLDMSLQNPYRCNFAQVFPKGKSFGIDMAIGKWFSPEIGLRLRGNWENGIPLFENGHLEWIAKSKTSGNSNMEDGGYFALYCDVMLNLNNMFIGYDPARRGSFLVFPRAGLASNLARETASPLCGVGFGYNYQLNERWALYADMAYQMSTSEFGGINVTGMSVSSGSNGFMDVHVGIQYNIGK